MIFITFLVLVYFALTLIGMGALWRYRRASPIFWFQGALALMAFGSFPLASPNLESDRVYLAIMLVAHLAFLLATLTTAAASRLDLAYSRFAHQGETSPKQDEIALCVLFFVVSAVISIVYYYLVGYNFVVMLFGGGIIGDYSDLRLAAYSGDQYFAPGYVNQFKNVLLPLTAVIVALRLRERKRIGLLIVFSALAAPGVTMALAGTGQRAYVIYTLAALAFGYFLHQSGRASEVKLRPILFASIPLLMLFVSLTSVYSGASDIGSAITNVFARFTTIQQEGGLFAFQYIYRFPIAWFGEWWQNLKGVVPGVEGSSIAHDVHAAMYGSRRGTVPLTSIGSAYFNGGVIGVMLLFIVLGIGYALLYRHFLNGERSYTRSYAYGFVFFYLSINVVDAPTVLLENGVLTALVFIGLLKMARKAGVTGRTRAGASHPSPGTVRKSQPTAALR